MKKFSFIIAAFAMICLASCGPKRSQAFYATPSQLISSNYDGTYVIRTQVRSRNAAIAFTDAQRKAVEEVIFNGVQSVSDGLPDLKPLCFNMNAREQHEQYFRAFFQDNGPWKQYVSLRDKRAGSTRYQRNGLQAVQSVTVSVDRDALRDRLIADGIIPAGGRY